MAFARRGKHKNEIHTAMDLREYQQGVRKFGGLSRDKDRRQEPTLLLSLTQIVLSE